MPAPKGNKFWLVRSSHGRNPIFAKPEDLWKSAQEYFEWVHANPLKEEKVFAYQGGITRAEISKIRAMTITGLCLFLDISHDAWKEYSARKGFIGVCAAIDACIRTQKFEGASADLLNANIIARDLGLADKTEHSGTVNFLDLADRVKRAKSRK